VTRHLNCTPQTLRKMNRNPRSGPLSHGRSRMAVYVGPPPWTPIRTRRVSGKS
jgi:hypothetical protein